MDAENTSTENNGLTKKELNQIWNRWYWMNEIPRTYERQVAPALMYALTPLLKKIYKDPEDLRDAYNRHLTFWNTDAIGGGSTSFFSRNLLCWFCFFGFQGSHLGGL